MMDEEVYKIRLDKYLVDQGYFSSREQAQAAIREKKVEKGGKTAQKPSELVLPGENVQVFFEEESYVSRGAYKLKAALDAFQIDLTGLSCLDAGASTGGFTDLMLRRGAKSVIAVEVGSGQLHERLLSEPRVRLLEHTNARFLTPERIGGEVDFCAADLSFISLTLVLPALYACCKRGAVMALLVKPQFELGPRDLGKNGIVKNDRLREEALQKVMQAALSLGLLIKGHLPSPIEGGESLHGSRQRGNREYLLVLQRP